MDAKNCDLTALRRELSDLIGQYSQGTVADFWIIDALAPISLDHDPLSGACGTGRAQ